VNNNKTQKEEAVFEGRIHTGVMQDKYPPGRISAGLNQPATATLVADLNPRVNKNTTRSQNIYPFRADDRPKHHGSEKRQTVQIAGRVSHAVKSEVVRLAKLKGWTESKTVATLVEQAIAGNLAEQFSVMLKNTLREAVTELMTKASSRAGNLALEALYSAEEGRVLTVYLLRLILGSDIDILPQIIKDAQDQTRENISLALHTRREQN
jgi:short subunit dehydrogenase-like uncharacterized protein